MFIAHDFEKRALQWHKNKNWQYVALDFPQQFV